MSKLVGELGEICASKYIHGKGYEIIQKNYHSKYGEIDIIVSNEEYIVFVEVKTRRYGSLIRGLEYVNKTKQLKIIKTALHYLQQNYINKQIRFDIIEVEFEDTENMYVKNHIENAFVIEGDGQYAIF